MAAGMHGPPHDLSDKAGAPGAARPDAVHSLFLAPLRFFQQHISPIDGPRCQFAPTCSSFGIQALREHGLWIGGMMTTDRLLRCSPLTETARYERRPDGRLADPIANNQWDK